MIRLRRIPQCRAMLAILLAISTTCNGFLYRSPAGSIKDNCIIYEHGQYYMYTMYWNGPLPATADRTLETQWRSVWLATSKDGVHWHDVGPVIKDAPFQIWAMSVWKVGNHYYMNHGSFTGSEQNVLKFWESPDLIHWTYRGVDSDVRRPDGGRLDRMNVLRLTENNRESWYGYASGGILHSVDGIHWQWLQDYPLTDRLDYRITQEPGGCALINGRYYLLVGGFFTGSFNYSVATYTSLSPRGPFSPDYKYFRLVGDEGRKFVAQWASFLSTPNELLVNNYIVDPSGAFFWHAPLKRAIVDQDGHLFLKYWNGNESLKGAPIPVSLATRPTLSAPAGASVTSISNSIQLSVPVSQRVPWETPPQPTTAIARTANALPAEAGFVLEGRIRVERAPNGKIIFPAVGLVFEEGPQRGTAVFLRTWGQTEIGKLSWQDGVHFDPEDRTAYGCATKCGLTIGQESTFRVLHRKGIFEFYLDDYLVQTWTTSHATGAFDLVVQDGQVTFTGLQAWKMDLKE